MTPNPIRQNMDYGERAQRLEKLKRKQRNRKKLAIYQSALQSFALVDPTGDVSITPIPYPPAEPAPNGMLDGIYPQEDRDSKPVSSLDYGILETHMADDEETKEEEKEEGFAPKPKRTNKSA